MTSLSFQVIFDSDPAPAGMTPAQQFEQMGQVSRVLIVRHFIYFYWLLIGQAMIRGVMDESGEQFVAYFLPTDETMAKRAEDASEVMLFWLPT